MPLILQSRRLRYIAGATAIFVCVFALLRAIFLFGFSGVDLTSADRGTLVETLSIGLRFDLRLALIMTLPLCALAVIPYVNLTSSAWVRRIAGAYWLLAPIGLIGFYILDFGYYAYLAQRVDSTVLRFFSNTGISARMMWESYPAFWIALGWITGVLVIWRLGLALSDRTVATGGQPTAPWKSGLIMALGLFVMVALMMGRFSTVPLRWSHAYFSGDSEMAALGLNPVLYFFDTFAALEAPYDEDVVRASYPLIADYLGVTERDPVRLNYDRWIAVQPHAVVSPSERKPNVIFIMLESLGASRVGIYGNPLKPTPTLDAMAEQGVWATNFYVPVSGTARTVFGSITGIADISKVETASRNPLITDQRVILNAFSNHDKYYFIGGSAGWANMSAFIHHSIPDIQMFEEGHHSEASVDVWGISDLGLFREFDRFITTREGDAPFVAFLQTAANHRPFTIPQDNDGFEIQEVDANELSQWGFKSSEQYNAVRFLDFNIGRLLEKAKQGGYYDNTIFILYGDHNNRITGSPHMPAFHTEVQLDLDGLHVPFIIHAPAYLAPKKITAALSLLDVMPTAAGLSGIAYQNTTMGRDIFIAAPEGERAVYVQSKQGGKRAAGMITRNFAVRALEDDGDQSLHALTGKMPGVDARGDYPEEFERLSRLLEGYLETTKFQFHHNRRSLAEARARGLDLN